MHLCKFYFSMIKQCLLNDAFKKCLTCMTSKKICDFFFFFHYAKSAQRTIARSKRNAWNENKITTLKETIEAFKKWKRKSNIKKMKHHKLFKEKKIAKYFLFHHFFWRNVEAISIFEFWLKFFRYRFFCNRFKWKSWNIHRQFVKFCRDFHVFFEIKYFFYFTKYCEFLCRKIHLIFNF